MKCAVCGGSGSCHRLEYILRDLRKRAEVVGIKAPAIGDHAHTDCVFTLKAQIEKKEKRRAIVR